MVNTIEINGMLFERTQMSPNFQGLYDTNPCSECHLDIAWVDYGGVNPCSLIDSCMGKDRQNSKDVFSVVGGVDKLKPKENWL